MDIIMTTADRLNDLITAKEDMKSAIEEKGVEVTGGLTSYADAIRDIKTDDTITYLPVGTKFAYSAFNRTASGHTYPDINNVINLINPNETNMSYMFSHCGMSSISQLDTSKVTNMSYMFSYCSVSSISQLDTSKVTNMSHMFDSVGVSNYDYRIMVTISDLDCSSVTNITDLFVKTEWTFEYSPSLESVPAFINLGKQQGIVGTDSLGFLWWRRLSREEYLRIVNALYNRAAAGYSVKKILLSSGTINNLSDADIALATNKGWSIIS